MEIPYSRLKLLFDKYYSGLATDAEIEELMLLVMESDDDEQLSELLRNAWNNQHSEQREFSKEESDNMLFAILNRSVQGKEEKEEIKIRTFSWVRYAAASVLLIFGFAFYWFENRPVQSPIAISSKDQFVDILPGGNRAVLTLSDGKQFDIDTTIIGAIGKNGAREFVQAGEGKLSTVALQSDKSVELQYNKLSTPRGGQYQITLQDGSDVWLNASSSIRFPTIFSEKERIVEITGEAYFEVKKDQNRPFIVKFGSSEVEVLGTTFNILAYDDESVAKTTLVEGSVRLRNASKSKILLPGEQGAITAEGNIKKTEVDINREIAWKNGLFYFKDSSIEEVMRQAARWYDIEVNYKGKMHVRQFTGRVPRNVNISELLNMLRYAGVKFEIKDKKVIVSM